MLPRKPATFLIAFLALACNAFADVQLPGIIIDHMLLQRDMPVRIFGLKLIAEGTEHLAAPKPPLDIRALRRHRPSGSSLDWVLGHNAKRRGG